MQIQQIEYSWNLTGCRAGTIIEGKVNAIPGV